MQARHTRVGLRRLLAAAATAAAIVLAACSSAADPLFIRDPPTFATGVLGTVFATDSGFPADLITIDSARVDGDTLAATVTHGGGCGNHIYQLVIGSAWMESFPVQVSARIAHNANGDGCRALVRQHLRMSLRPLADAYRASYQQEHGTVSIQLSGVAGPLTYKF